MITFPTSSIRAPPPFSGRDSFQIFRQATKRRSFSAVLLHALPQNVWRPCGGRHGPAAGPPTGPEKLRTNLMMVAAPAARVPGGRMGGSCKWREGTHPGGALAAPERPTRAKAASERTAPHGASHPAPRRHEAGFSVEALRAEPRWRLPLGPHRGEGRIGWYRATPGGASAPSGEASTAHASASRPERHACGRCRPWNA